VEENLEEKEFVKGLLGMSLEVEWETRGSREKDNEITSAGAFLCVGVRKSYIVPGLRQGTSSEERGVTKLSPSNPILGGENSTGTLPKFKKRGTSEGGLLRNRGGEKGFLTEGNGVIPVSLVETSSAELFPLLRTASGSASDVAKGKCG
jgi:hypothetical protein